MASTVRTDKVGPVSGSADFTLPTSDGTAGQFLKTDGSLGLGFATVASTVYGLNSVQTITASGTWTKPTGVTKIIVEVQAGGGGAGNPGGPGGAYNGGSGGGGAYARKFLDVTDIDTATVTVGAAGAVVTVGGTSSFAKLAGSGSFTTITAVGGGGAFTAGPGTTQGDGGIGAVAPTTGDFNVGGGNGTSGGAGAGNVAGGAFLGITTHINYAVNPPLVHGYGSGGSAGSGASGLPGGPGIVIVTEYK